MVNSKLLLEKKDNESIDQYNERVSKLYYSNGYYIKEIAKKLNIDAAEVYNYVTSGRKITTASEREEMVNLYNRGYSYSEIAVLLNKSRHCVRERIKQPSKINCKISKNLTDKQINKMKNMVKKGESLNTIANKLGISVGSLKNRLNHCGRSKSFTYVTKNEVKKFIRLYKNGYSITKIGTMCNRHRHTVARHIHRAGL